MIAHKFAVTALVLASSTLGCVYAAPTTTVSNDFNGFNIGTVNGQGGWGVTGPYDQEVVDLGSGNKALRLSNRVTTGSFGDQTFAPRPGGIPANTVTDPDNSAPGFFAGQASTGAAFTKYIASFDFRSVLESRDPGARITISPDNGSGGRQGFVALESTATGVSLSTFDVDDTTGQFSPAPVSLGSVPFAEWHKIRYEILFGPGIDDDVATIFLDNSLVATINSWERYYQVTQPAMHPLGVPVQTLLFRMSGTAAQNAQGFFIDNVLIQLDNGAEVPIAPTGSLVALGLMALAVSKRRR